MDPQNPQADESIEARLDLMALDFVTRGQDVAHPVVVEVVKAITLASVYRGIESRIHCRTPEQVTQALTIIYSRKVWKREKATWNVAEAGLEFPNGSIVVVMLDGKRAVPR